MKFPLQGRVGEFMIPYRIACRNYCILSELLGKVFIVKAEIIDLYLEVRYVGYSELFDDVGESGVIPRYVVNFERKVVDDNDGMDLCGVHYDKGDDYVSSISFERCLRDGDPQYKVCL